MLALVVDTSAHPRAMCYKCYNESIPAHIRLALNEFQAFCYSHHKSQPALSEIIDSLDCQDATLPWILTRAYRWGTTMDTH